MKLFKSVVLILLLLIATWRVLVLGMAEYYVDKAQTGDISAAAKALTWDSNHPQAAFLSAQQIMETDPARAELLLRKSIQGNPAKAEPVILLATLLADKGEVVAADKLARQAAKLQPALPQARLVSANYWVKRQLWAEAIADWEAALVTNPLLGERIFPVMQQMAENARARPLLKPLTDNPPVWWTQFYQHLTRKSASLEAIVAIANMRRQSERPFTLEERGYLVDRLLRSGEWPGAYLAWVNGLNEEQLQHLGSVYNGELELQPSNRGFGWHLPDNNRIFEVRWSKVDGRGSGKALRLIFRNKEALFKHLYQPLFLAPGKYQFQTSVMVDRLRGRGGVKWVIQCVQDKRNTLGETEVLIGLSEWQTINFNFVVPDDDNCRGQNLRLESTGKSSYDHKLEGDVWFDDVAIRSVPGSK